MANRLQTSEEELLFQQTCSQYSKGAKQFGILERPSLSPSIPEISFKINLIGKSGSGKTKLVSILSGKENSLNYMETLGIHVKDIYWPTKLNEKILFKLQFWECGESFSKKYSYMSSACNDGADVIGIIVNRGDKSTLTYLENKLEFSTVAVVCFVIDSPEPNNIEVSNQDLENFSKTKKCPLFCMPSCSSNFKNSSLFFNDLCEHLYRLRL